MIKKAKSEAHYLIGMVKEGLPYMDDFSIETNKTTQVITVPIQLASCFVCLVIFNPLFLK